MDGTALKIDRVLKIYSRLVNGDILQKKELAQQFHVTERSVQRDMESLRCFFAEQGLRQDIVYDKAAKGYRLENPTHTLLNNSEILAVCKILLESRSMRKDEMLPILDKLVACCVPERSKRAVTELLSNEKYHYVEPHHGQRLLPGMWEIGQAVQNHQVMEIEYERLKAPKLVRRRVLPVGIMFSEYYFYLTAFLEDKTDFDNPDDLFPTIYRIDRIQDFKVLDEHFKVPYKDRFQEGEFRKRVQFMLSVISDIDSYVEDIDDYLNLVPATTDSLQRLSSFTSTKAANTLPSHLYEVIQTARLGMLSPYLYSFIDAFYRKAQGDTEVPELEGLKPEDYVSFFSSVSPIAHLLDAKRARHFEYSRHQMIENEAQEKITTGDVQEITKVYRELWRKYKVPVKDRDLTIVERPSDGLFSMEVAVCLEDLSALEEICLEYEDEYEDEDDNT